VLLTVVTAAICRTAAMLVDMAVTVTKCATLLTYDTDYLQVRNATDIYGSGY